MSDLLTNQLRQLGFAVLTGQLRLTPGQREALADLNAAAALADRLTAGAACASLQLVPTPDTKEPA